MANPKNPAVAAFPVPPPLPNWPVVDENGMATPAFAQFLQFMWASIQGTGGIIDIVNTTVFEESPTFSPDTEIGKRPILAEMPESHAVQPDRLWLLAERSYADLYRRILNAEILAVLAPLPNIPFKLKSYTVAKLPVGIIGDIAYVTDANGPTFLTAVVGGGAVVCPVFNNGTTWVAF